MAFTDYSGLKAEIADWLDRDDLTSQIDSFIDLAELSLNRDLRARKMEKRATADTTASDAEIGVPSDFLQLRFMHYVTGGNRYNLEYVPPSYLNKAYQNNTTGQPRLVTIIGDEFRFAPIPDAAYTIEVDYYAEIPALSDDNTSNWVLANHPDLYLFKTLLYAEPFLVNDKRIPTWQMYLADAIDSVKKSDTQTPSQPLSMKVA